MGAEALRTNPDQQAQSTFFLAVKSGHPGVIQALLEPGADVHAQDAASNSRALHAAAACGYVAVVRVLLEAGASPHAVDKDGDTPLHYAVSEHGASRHRGLGNERQRQVGLPHPAAVPARDSLGTVEVLLAAGADCTLSNNKGEYPVQTAVIHNKLAALEVMLRHEDPAVCHKQLQTALSVAARKTLKGDYGPSREQHGALILRRLAVIDEKAAAACLKQCLEGASLNDERKSVVCVRILTAWAQDTAATDRQHQQLVSDEKEATVTRRAAQLAIQQLAA